MNKIKYLLASLLTTCAMAQPPAARLNTHLAQSTWPIYHANNYASSSVIGEQIVVPTVFQGVPNLSQRRFRSGLVSPWTVIRAPTADQKQVVLTSPVNGVAKYIIEAGRLHPVDFLPLERRILDFDWGILLLADGTAVVTEQRKHRFAIIGDENDDPSSPLRVLRRIPIDVDLYGELTAHFTLSYDGVLIALTEKPSLLAINPDSGKILSSLELSGEVGLTTHNSFPIDEDGRMYFGGQRKMFAIDWVDGSFHLAWESDYNMRGPGFESTRTQSKRQEFIAVARGEAGTGSGTTPSLIGSPETGVVVTVDGHSPQNHLVAFWRNQIPPDWQALPDPHDPRKSLDSRVAGILPLPFSTPEGEGHTAENSPAVLGNKVVIAQWAGFRPDGTPPKGVQRVDWNPQTRKLELVWANPNVHINGVPSIGQGASGAWVFGMGRDGDRYVYSILDLVTGDVVRQLDLGSDDAVLDQGNNHIICGDGSIIYGGKDKLIRLYKP